VSIYGFSQPNAAALLKMVRREGLAPRVENSLRSPQARSEDDPSVVAFKNNASETVPAWGVMQITEWILEGEDSDFPVAKITKPNTTFNRVYLVNLEREVEQGGYGAAKFHWNAGFALYDTGSGTPAAGESWGPQSGQWTLKKNYYGFATLGGNITTDSGKERTAIVQTGVDSVFGKIDSSSVSKNGTGTVSVWDSVFGADITAWDLTVYNHTVALSTVSGKQCKVSFVGNRPVFDWVECS